MNDDREIKLILDAAPSKRVITNKANMAEFENAISEIVDNCIDYWKERDYDKDLNFEVNIKGKELVTITWNMGIPEERWLPLIKLGEKSHKDSYSIGVWGEGFKIAIFAIGREIDIYSRNKNEIIDICIPKSWLGSPSWDIQVLKESKKHIPEDSTTIEIKSIIKTPTHASTLTNFIGEIFGTIMKQEEKNGHKIKIKINGTEVKPITYATKEDIEENFAFIPGLEPTEHILGEVCGLNVKMIIGLLGEANEQTYGVYLYGNGRLFAKQLRDETVGFGSRSNSTIPTTHPHAKRLQAHIFFDGVPDLIPWSAPLKNGFNVSTEISKYIPDLIKEYGEPLIYFVKNTKATEIFPYTKKWQTLSEERKKIKIFDKSADKRGISKKEMEEEWKNAPESIKKGIDVSGRIDVWDHTLTPRAPARKAKYDSDIRKSIIKLATSQRDTGKIGAIELNSKILDIAGESKLKAMETRAELQNLLEDDTQPMSIRLSNKEINELRLATHENKPTEILSKIIDTYKKVQKIKAHTIFKNVKASELDDEPFMTKLNEILNRMVKK